MGIKSVRMTNPEAESRSSIFGSFPNVVDIVWESATGAGGGTFSQAVLVNYRASMALRYSYGAPQPAKFFGRLTSAEAFRHTSDFGATPASNYDVRIYSSDSTGIDLCASKLCNVNPQKGKLSSGMTKDAYSDLILSVRNAGPSGARKRGGKIRLWLE